MVETRVSPDFADQAVRLAGTKRALASAAMMDLRMQLAAQRDRRALGVCAAGRLRHEMGRQSAR